MAMEIGISSASFFGKKYTENTIELMEEMGVGVAEIFLTTFMEYEEDFVRELARRKNTLKIHSVHSLTNQFEPQLFNMAERTKQDSLRFYEKICKAAQILGAGYYTFHGPGIVKKTPYKVNYESMATRLNELIDVASGYDTQLSFENVHWTFFSSPEFFRKMRPLTPKLRCTLDIKQAMQSKIDYKEFLTVMGGSLSTVHVCDYLADGSLKVPGEGIFDFKELFQRLADMGYENPVIMELYANDYSDFDQVKRGFEYLKNTLYHVQH